MGRGTRNRERKWSDEAHLRIIWHPEEEEVETETGTAGTASSVFALLILLAKSGLSRYQCRYSDPCGTVQMSISNWASSPSQNEKDKKFYTKRKSKTALIVIPLHEGQKWIQTVPFSATLKQSSCFTLAGLFNLGEEGKNGFRITNGKEHLKKGCKWKLS